MKNNKTLELLTSIVGPSLNYEWKGEQLIINGGLYLNSLTSSDKDFLKGTTINGGLGLNALTSADKDFLKDTTINGWLSLESLTSADKDFLKDTKISGSLFLNSLRSADKDFLKDTTINGSLSLESLTSADKDFLKDTTINGCLCLNSLTSADKVSKNVKQLKEGYNANQGYCFFDGILSKVISTSTRNGVTIYKTPFDFVVQKGKLTAHSTTVKQGIIDINFKEYVATLTHKKLSLTDYISVELYRAITGACYGGIEGWLRQHNIGFTSDNGVPKLTKKTKLKTILPLLEQSNPYGFAKLQSLIEA